MGALESQPDVLRLAYCAPSAFDGNNDRAKSMAGGEPQARSERLNLAGQSNLVPFRLILGAWRILAAHLEKQLSTWVC